MGKIINIAFLMEPQEIEIALALTSPGDDGKEECF